MKIYPSEHSGAFQARGNELRVGFVPLVDAAPLIIAKELGYFDDYGLNVRLERELGWATVRDKIIFGELHAAHALAGLVLAAHLGIRCQARPCATGLIMNSHGNAVTLSRELYQLGIRDAKSFAVRVRMDRKIRRYTLGVVSGVSSHHFLLKLWLKSAGLDSTRDIRIITLPPSLMVSNLEEGNIDGFCVGEPWNTVAVKQAGGVVVATSNEISPGHPEKVLMASSDFIEQREDDYVSLGAAVLEGCRFCHLKENHQHVAEILSQRRYLNTDPSIILESLSGKLAMDKDRKAETASDLHLFYGGNVNVPNAQKVRWLWNQIEETIIYPFLSPKELKEVLHQAFLDELFRKIEARMASNKDRKPSRQTALTTA
ncbi:MAG: CmpA/NrtA family ABC transporter substrate-binding protein [Verrucomicrobiota bacterium]